MPSPTLTGFEQRVIVGVADMAVSNNQDIVLITYSLGSCIGMTIYDPVAHVGGLLHAMLPDSALDPGKATVQPAMFVDTGLRALFNAASKLKAEKERVQICVAGASQILDSSDAFSIGRRNHDAMARLLEEHRLAIMAEQVGGLVSRTMYLNLRNGEVRLRVSGQSSEVTLCKN